ncbi:hypothetical protein [Martelella mangrovi]|uniref:Uncharacterized protein n=1 Tax=Martelella mangrovi TaxID=1397477 RepID=A0ABV2I7R7_9HYPH|nr:hypothetical protein [uncultured Martelella sp.]
MTVKMPENDNSETLTEEGVIYIKQILGQLRRLSDKEGAEMLCYLIDMAYLEAGELQSLLISDPRSE